MAAYEDFYPYILPELPGANELIVQQAVRSACIEFCEKSLILTRDHDPITIAQGVVDYEFDVPSGYLVTKVQRAWLNNNPLHPLAPDAVRDADVYNRTYSGYQSAPSTPTHFLQKDERTISVYPVPDKAYSNGLTLRVALKPTRASTEVEDVVFEDYAEVIAAGALARLQMSPGKPYTDINQSGANRALFLQGINLARSRATHGNVRSSLSVQLRKI